MIIFIAFHRLGYRGFKAIISIMQSILAQTTPSIG
jgi:hypothetical protein